MMENLETGIFKLDDIISVILQLELVNHEAAHLTNLSKLAPLAFQNSTKGALSRKISNYLGKKFE
jgi:hypothetical protein